MEGQPHRGIAPGNSLIAGAPSLQTQYTLPDHTLGTPMAGPPGSTSTTLSRYRSSRLLTPQAQTPAVATKPATTGSQSETDNRGSLASADASPGAEKLAVANAVEKAAFSSTAAAPREATLQTSASPAALAAEAPLSLSQRWVQRLPQPTLGETSTFVAMLPQAVFAGLLSFELLESWGSPVWLDGVLALAVAAGVEAGKFVLLEFLGRPNWERLQTQVPSFSMTPASLIELALRINAAGTFAYLSYVAWADPQNGLPKLLNKLGAERLAAAVQVPAFWFLLGSGPSLACNLLSFGPIHRFGSQAAQDLMKHLFSLPADEKNFLLEQLAHHHGLNLLTEPFNELVLTLRSPESQTRQALIDSRLLDILRTLECILGRPEDISYELKSTQEKIIALLEQDKHGLNLFEAFRNMGQADDGFDPRQASVFTSRLSYLLGAACFITAVAGLYNFFFFGQAMGNLFFGTPALGYITGTMSLISMSVMAAFAAEFGVNLGNRMAGTESRQYPNILTPGMQSRIFWEAVVVCFILGGLANAEQANIVGQGAGLMICAILASAFLEWFGWGKSRYSAEERRVLDQSEFGDGMTRLLKLLLNFIKSMEYDGAAHPGPTALTQLKSRLSVLTNRSSDEPAGYQALPGTDAQGATNAMRKASAVSAAPAVQAAP